MALTGNGFSATRQTLRPEQNPGVYPANRAPTSSDINFHPGLIWLDQSSGGSYILNSVSAGAANWEMFVDADGAVLTLTGDSGGAQDPDGSGDIAILGDSTDGVSVVGTTNTLTINIAAASTTQRGSMETATDAEAIAAASTTVAVVPANLAALTATNLTALSASGSDTNSASSTAKYVTPGSLASLTATNMAALVASTAQVQNRSSAAVVPTCSVLPAIFSGSNNIFTSAPVMQSVATTGAAPAGTTGAINIMSFPGQADEMYQYIIGAGQTIIAPRMSSAGLLVSLDLTDDEGAEYCWNPTGALTNVKHCYTIGTSAAFQMNWTFTLADVSGCDPVYIGFRKAQAFDQDYTQYTDFALIGVNTTANAGTITIETQLNGAGNTKTNTTDAWTDGQSHTLAVLVSGAGVVTYTIDGVAPTATAAYTFDTADVVIPVFHMLHGATTPGAINWSASTACKVGFQ